MAVTGMGVKSPAGNTVAEAFATVLTARSTAVTVDSLADAELKMPVACLVPDYDTLPYFTAREARSIDRTAQLGIAAAMDAMKDSGLDAAQLSPERCGVYVGTGGSGLAATAELIAERRYRQGKNLSAYTAALVLPNATSARVSIALGLLGSCLTYNTACASGGTALGEAMRAVRSGALDVVVSGGTESSVSPLVMEGFRLVGAMSRRAADPAAASRPFDADRDGFVMGEGAAFLVLEDWDHARRRGATVYAELSGYGTTCDAFNIVAPDPRADGMTRCINAALDDAAVHPQDVGHVNAHGTATVQNDYTEALALRRVFGQKTPPVTATKGVVGHLIGGAGAFEAVMTVCALRAGVVPATANLVAVADTAPLNVVAGDALEIASAPALSNSFGFGGHNVALLFRPAP